MSKGANHNSEADGHPEQSRRHPLSNCKVLPRDSSTALGITESNTIRHIYVHIPFCARICPYCAFYKDLLDRSQAQRFCEAILQELAGRDHSSLAAARARRLFPFTIYFGGGTPTALNIAQLEMLLRGFRERLDLSQLIEWSIEANPGSVSARKAAVLEKFGVNRISLGVLSWDDKLLKLLGRE